MASKKVVIEKANRLFQLPPPLFSLLRKEKTKTSFLKTNILNFSKFSWPIETEVDLKIDSDSLKPAGDKQIQKLKETIADWFQKKHNQTLIPEKEIYIGGGIRNLLLNLGLAFIDKGELSFVPGLGYPHYRRTIAACGGGSITYELNEKNNWLPEMESFETPAGRVAKLMFLNSPHNPTGTTLSAKEMNFLIRVAAKENILIINDAAYQSLSELNPVSLLSSPGGKKVGVELYSFSYTFGLPALPFGFVVGNRDVINGLKQIESLAPQPILDLYVDLAITAIKRFPNENLKKIRRLISRNYGESLKLIEVLEIEEVGQRSVPFLWAKISGRRSALRTANLLYRQGRIMTVPGTEFGDSGEGYLRFSLTEPTATYVEACKRITKKRRLFKQT
jgi:LL-diaminopimelate aminotransferase